MTTQDVIKIEEELSKKGRSLIEKKNHDYCGGKGDGIDPFLNFRTCEHNQLCSAEVGILVRIGDKLQRITTFVNQGTLKVTDESFEDTIIDARNYLALLYALKLSRIEPKKSQGEATGVRYLIPFDVERNSVLTLGERGELIAFTSELKPDVKKFHVSADFKAGTLVETDSTGRYLRSVEEGKK